MAQVLHRVQPPHLLRLYATVEEALAAALVLPAQLEAEGGRGLWLVEQLARSWGVRPHPDGGKVVWCALNL